MTALLDVRDLYLHYGSPRGPVRAVDGISFTIQEPGQALGIVGESGSGKTSIALALMRVLPRNVARYDGQVYLDGTETLSLSEGEFRRQVRWGKMSMVFQGAMNAFNPVLRIGEQIAEPAREVAGASKKHAEQEARRVLGLVGLPPETLTRYPHELSGGMKQRCLVAMALVLQPQIIILDEPTSALDVSIQAQIMNLLKRLKAELGLSMLFITHDIALASDLCDRIAVAYAGQIVEQGTAEQVLLAPKHPYTQRLLASVPRLHAEKEPEFIPGVPPDLTAPPAGCRFHPRCPFAFQPCDHDPLPPSFQPEPGHIARCWLLARAPSPPVSPSP